MGLPLSFSLKMKFLGQGFQKLEQDRQTDRYTYKRTDRRDRTRVVIGLIFKRVLLSGYVAARSTPDDVMMTRMHLPFM